MKDDSYSQDVEIDDRGVVVAARELAEGELIAIPKHMFRLIRYQHRFPDDAGGES